jgi:hypothetical protein
LAQPV